MTETLLKTSVCKQCGAEFQHPRKPGGQPKHCSQQCREQAWLQANREWRLRNVEAERKRCREYKKANPTKNDPQKQNARSNVKYRVQRGYWPKPSFFQCTDCASKAQEYHHEDYSQWWSVLPLCKPCHKVRHRKTA